MRLEASLSQSRKDSQTISQEHSQNKKDELKKNEEDEEMSEESVKKPTSKPIAKPKSGRLKKLGAKIFLNGQFLVSSEEEDENKNSSDDRDSDNEESEEDDKDFMESPRSKSRRLCQPLLTQKRQQIINKKISQTSQTNQVTSSPKLIAAKTTIEKYFNKPKSEGGSVVNRSLTYKVASKEIKQLSKSNIEIEKVHSATNKDNRIVNNHDDKSSDEAELSDKENEISIIETDDNQPTTSKKANLNATTQTEINDMSLESVNVDENNEANDNNTKKKSSKQASKKTSVIHTRKSRWSETETLYLLAGVEIYGKGNWAKILSEFSHIIKDRTSVHVKDRYRNVEKSLEFESLKRRANMLLAQLRSKKSPFKLRQTE